MNQNRSLEEHGKCSFNHLRENIYQLYALKDSILPKVKENLNYERKLKQYKKYD